MSSRTIVMRSERVFSRKRLLAAQARSRGGSGGGGVASSGGGGTTSQKSSVPSAEATLALGAERDLELLAEEQVLGEEALAAAEGANKDRQEEPEDFDHPGQDRRW
jgi:hypothetical protein